MSRADVEALARALLAAGGDGDADRAGRLVEDALAAGMDPGDVIDALLPVSAAVLADLAERGFPEAQAARFRDKFGRGEPLRPTDANRRVMTVYHRTYHAEAILRGGFRDGYYSMPGIGDLRGVFVSAPWPLDENEGADGDVVLAVEVPEDLFAEYEHIEEGKTYREAMIPAAELSRYPVRVLSDDEVDDLTVARFDRFAEHDVTPGARALEDTVGLLEQPDDPAEG